MRGGGQTPPGGPVLLHDLVARAARRSPEAPAVRAPEGELSYRGLDEAAGRYAGALAARGVAPGDRVVLWAGKSLELVAAMQGCLRLGAVYVPVTEANPPSRLARICHGCTPALVLTDAEGAGRAAGAGFAAAPVVTFEALLADAPAPGAGAPAPLTPDDPAYILYTSGSTGEPKGVCLSHRNALAFVVWAADMLRIGPHDRLSNHAPFNFDLSVFDLYAAFHAGASVHLIPQQLAYAPEQLVRLLMEQELTVWYSVPSALTLMAAKGGLLEEQAPPGLRVCLVAGEPFPLPLAQRLRRHWPDVRIFNWYGPTETNVCTSYEVTGADLERTTPLPIGTAASGDELELAPLERDGGGPEGAYELRVTGPSVMLGYWGGPAQSGAYATGDLVRLDPEGNLEYLGRRDQMVKIRGQRVELGEIEAVIGSHPDVGDVAAVVVGTGLEAALHAVAVAVPGRTPTLLGLKLWSAERLPSSMVLDVLHLVDELPRTPNGKMDKRRIAGGISSGWDG
ncbi:amino acid adenylation domain-containing protein [Streptomyces sp. MAR4 CNX-425]|uniref:amino acid adenylation domain-containing protein n=1 Tax=Streptomyces sp. MAR4 CNX-425 TaxID=3406343 RepID=UPI003B511656